MLIFFRCAYADHPFEHEMNKKIIKTEMQKWTLSGFTSLQTKKYEYTTVIIIISCILNSC